MFSAPSAWSLNKSNTVEETAVAYLSLLKLGISVAGAPVQCPLALEQEIRQEMDQMHRINIHAPDGLSTVTL